MKKIKEEDKIEPTHGMKRSIKEGERMLIAGTNYAGRNPQTSIVDGKIKVRKGLPFVNLDKLKTH